MQQQNFIMEIVSRLKRFLDLHHIPVTQFADRCGIPRPSLSQLLSGRNKKVSDEVITKIHDAFPSLSMMWLLFGEGEMENANPVEYLNANSRNASLEEVATVNSVPRTHRIDFGTEFEKVHPSTSLPLSPESSAFSSQTQPEGTEDANANEKKIAFLTGNADSQSGKRVVSIVVYYDDKTFESFFPDPKRRSPL